MTSLLSKLTNFMSILLIEIIELPVIFLVRGTSDWKLQYFEIFRTFSDITFGHFSINTGFFSTAIFHGSFAHTSITQQVY